MALLAGHTLLAVDTETTGFDVKAGNRLVEVAWVRIVDGRVVEDWSTLVNPGRPIPPDATKIHRITDAMVRDAPSPAAVGKQVREALADLPLVLHNAPFDMPFLQTFFEEAGVPPLANPVVDTLGLARELFGAGGNRLFEVSKRLGVELVDEHRALGDSRATAHVFLGLAQRWEERNPATSLAEMAAFSQDKVRLTSRR